ncbi:MAG: hypothetical protein KAJ19_17035 [Gammaproteobacteria bacterium]|nr:hypothetical protein [Gammaproteobacteria bacterium]
MTSPLFIETDGANRLNLFNGTLKVIEGWFPNAAGDDPNVPIWETIPLVAEGTSAQITAALLDLRNKLRIARSYQKDTLVNTPVYLGMEFDAIEAHSCILKGSLKPVTKVGTSPYLDTLGYQVKAYVLRVLRVPYWEEQTADELAVNNISGWGGTADFSNTEGTRDARIFQSYASGIGLGKMWMGWRKERAGFTNFVPRVEMESGSLVDADTTFTEDLDGRTSYETPAMDNCSVTTFSADVTLIKRVKISIDQHITDLGGTPETDAKNYKGRYLVIGKFKNSDSTSKIGIQLKHGYSQSRSLIANQEIVFTDDSWRSVPMGIVSLPPVATHLDSGIVDDDLQLFTFEFWAEQISGAATLKIDGFVLMPTDHLVTVTRNPNLAGGLWKYYFWTRMDGRPNLVGASLVGEIPNHNGEASFQNFKIPLDNSKLVYVREVGDDDAQAYQGLIATDDLYFYWKSAWDDFFVSRV